MKGVNKKDFFVVSLLVIIDQVIKLIIKFNFFDETYNIIGDYVRFEPIINHKMSWVGTFIDVLSNPILITVINVIAIYLLFCSYRYFKFKTSEHNKNLNILFLMAIAGGICSLIDKVFWGGSLDYIALKNLFIFDLKDCYITFFGIGLIIYSFKMDDDISLKEFFEFNFNKKKNRK